MLAEKVNAQIYRFGEPVRGVDPHGNSLPPRDWECFLETVAHSVSLLRDDAHDGSDFIQRGSVSCCDLISGNFPARELLSRVDMAEHGSVWAHDIELREVPDVEPQV